MSKKKDLDYVAISARVHAMENRLLSRERMERMIDAKDLSEAAKVLTECGYGEMNEMTGSELERILAEQQQNVMKDLAGGVPDSSVVDLFKLRYDYHNAKVLVKAEALGTEQDALLQGGGRYEREALAEDYRRGDLHRYADVFCRGIERAREVLGASGDPQQADFILDRAYFEELSKLADKSGSKLLRDYAALSVDVANLRAAVRASRLGKGSEFLNRVLVPGGTVSERTLAMAKGDELGNVFRSGCLAEAAAEGAAKSAHGSGSLTEFERLCDNALMTFFGDAGRVPFGLEPIVGYLYAREAETTAIRTIMSGRMAGLDGAVIRQRLRRTYC
ncbi:MAG: V-type ATPase subunit [Oscillospiraceae bacterium]|nr:V-type ATPase subunit [Oscillospiraceae bacterium]